MVDKELFDIFQDVKETLCKYDYYIHTSKKILHLTHTEDQIPHLMGLQYIHNEKFIGDSGAYLIKKKRLKRNSLARIVSRIYRKKKLQESILDMIDRKLDNLEHLNEMLSSPSVIYLYDPGKNPESELRTDYLMVYKDAKKVIQLGLVKSKTKEKSLYHCNSFIVSYISQHNYDQYYRNLLIKYEILKIVREDKISKRAKVIYQSQKSVVRELSGIEKILQAAGLFSKELQNSIFQLNQTFGKYHALEMLNDAGTLTDQCQTPDEETMVNEFLKLWNSTKSPLHQ